jgi:hypothetical protein
VGGFDEVEDEVGGEGAFAGDPVKVGGWFGAEVVERDCRESGEDEGEQGVRAAYLLGGDGAAFGV